MSSTGSLGSSSSSSTAAAASGPIALPAEATYRGTLLTGLFAENFWGEPDVFAGFDVLSKQMRKGRKETVEIITYLKERIAIEEDYAKRLGKLAKQSWDAEGFGAPKASEDQMDSTLYNAFRQVKEATDQLAMRHRLLADDLNKNLYKPLENNKENQKKMVTDANNKVLVAQKEFAAMRALVPKLRKAYEAKCTELEGVKQELESMGGITSKDKRADALQKKMAKLQKEVEAADLAYSQSVQKLEQSRLTWEEDVTESCHLFEGIEIDRIQLLKDKLTEFVLMFDRMHQATRGLIDQQKTYMECIKADIDIEVFVTFYRTGVTHPGPTLYENFYTGLLKDAVFGVSLASHLEATGRTVPLLLEKCMSAIEKRGLRDEGIYRLSGRLAKVRTLRAQFDKKDAAAAVDLEGDADVQINDVASLMKLYLRELPEPLLTFHLYDNMIAAVTGREEEVIKAKLKPLIAQLPAGNHATLRVLLAHLRKVAAEEAHNKMGVPNLAIIFGPCLVRSKNEANALKDFRTQSKLVEDLLRFYDDLFD